MGNRTAIAIMFFVINLGINLAFDNNEESHKIFFYQMLAIVCYATTHWLTEKYP